MRIEAHVLQNFAPSNLNRDDTGSPKDAEFGGYRRARISSQCQKRAVRTYFREHRLLPPGSLSERTKRLAGEVERRLAAAGRPAPDAARAARAAVSAFLPKSDAADEHKTPYLLFLGAAEIERFAGLVGQHFDAFAAPPADTGPAPGVTEPKGGKKPKRPKADEGPKPPDGFEKAVERLLDGGKAADLALFGRMLADLPENNVDAACQVAHAISTNKVHTTEMDYYTAVDDLKPDDTAGADMIGTVAFNSACYYRYANLDLGQLRQNLQNDDALAGKAAGAFLTAFVHAVPTGKQNTFAAHNPPSLVYLTVRTGTPVSFANAFVRPVAPREDGSLVEESIRAMDDYHGRVVKMYGDGGRTASAVCQTEGVGLEHLKDAVDGVDQAIAAAVAAAFPNGGAA